jgi:hypothetical protein
MAMALPVLLDVGMALQRQHDGPLTSTTKAHKVLKELREALAAPATEPGGPLGYTQEVHVFHPDASQGGFDWVGYVANRPPAQIEKVIGEGIVRFEARFLRMMDKNMKQYRFDFVALRADGTAVRFHPSSTGDTVPVIGDPQQWAIGDAPMQAPAWHREVVPDADPNASQGSQVGRRAVFHVHAQADVLGARDATTFIQSVASRWEHGGEKFTRDLTHPRSEFPWDCYLASTEWGQAIHEAGGGNFLAGVGRRRIQPRRLLRKVRPAPHREGHLPGPRRRPG